MCHQRFMAAAVLLVSLVLISWCALQADRADQEVQKAFQLRMDGKSAEAKALLEKLVAEKPRNAAAHYELARTKYYMGLGNFIPDGTMKDVGLSIEKAMEMDPGNANYALFAGHAAFMEAYISIKKTSRAPGRMWESCAGRLNHC